jgi:hypothetical protein
MEASNLPGLCRIPNELLYKIVDALDDESAFQLGLTCTDLHIRALPILFERHGIKSLNTGQISLHNCSKHVLRALTAALFIQDVDNIVFCPNSNFEDLHSNILAMTPFVARLPQVTVFNLHFGGYEAWLASLFLNNSRSSDAQRWMENLLDLLNTVLKKGCRTLQVHRASHSDPLPVSLQNATRWTAPIVQQSIGSTLNPPQHQRRGSRMLSIFQSWSPSPPVQSSSISHTTEGRQKLSEFRIHSQVILQRPFIPWIRSVFQANTASITTLSFKSSRKEHAAIWKDILSSTTLLSLYEFELTCHEDVQYWMPVEFTVLILFLWRHPSIRYLHLTAIYIPIPFSYPPFFFEPLLPQLVKLEAQPLFTSWLLNARAPFPRFQHLLSVTVVSDYRPKYVAMDYDGFDAALSAIAHYTAHSTDNIHLGLRFVAEFAVAQWMLRHLSPSTGITRSGVSALRRVTKLSVYTTDQVSFHADREVLHAVPLFLALFPCLEDVSFEQPGLEVLDPEMVQNITEVCHRLERLSVNPRR